MGESASAAVRLTARGAETRSRIVARAADLIRVQGVGGTTLDDVVATGKVSKSQFYSHFADKTELVRAVIELVGERVIARERAALATVSDLADLRRWRDDLVAANAVEHGRYGCALGSLANEVADQDGLARTKLDELFTAWRELFEGLLRGFQRDGDLPAHVDVDQLAIGFVASIQGGYLLAQAGRDVAPMASAIDVAISHLELLMRGTASQGQRSTARDAT